MEQQGFFDNQTTHGTANIKPDINHNERTDTMTTETIERNTDLAPYRPNVPSTELGAFGIEGLESLDRNDLVLPRKTILQPTSKKDGEAGCFHDNLTNTAVPEIECVILSITHTRSLWSGDPSAERPECTAMDGISGSRYGKCALCQFNPNNNATLWEKGQKRCGPGYLLLAADRNNDDAMFIFSALKTSAKPVKPFITELKTQRRRPPFYFLTRMTTSQEKNDLGKFYVLKLAIICPLGAADVEKYHQMYLSMRDAVIRDIEDDEPVGDAPPDFDESGEPF